MNRKMITAAALFIALVSVSASAADSAPAAPPAPPPPVMIAPPMKRTVTETEEFTGRFAPSASVQVRARVGGYVESVKFKEGQDVHKGDVLVSLDTRPFQLAKDRAAAVLELARKDYERLSGLKRTGAVSAQEVDVAFEKLRVAEVDVKEAQMRLDFTEVHAPFDGRAGRRLVDPGALVSGGDAGATPLVTVTASHPLYFYFDLGEREWTAYQLRCGGGKSCPQPVKAKLVNETAFTHEGAVDFAESLTDRDTGAMTLRAVFPNTDRALTPGMFGRLLMQTGAPREVTVTPDEATGMNQSQRFVYVVDSENTVQMRPVVTGRVYDGMRVIVSGLSPSDRVVMENVMKVRPGMKVEPKPYAPPAPPAASGQ